MSAAEMIAVKCNLNQVNPKIVLATIQKESGLVTCTTTSTSLLNPMGVKSRPVVDFYDSLAAGVTGLHNDYAAANTEIQQKGFCRVFLYDAYTSKKYHPSIYLTKPSTGAQYIYTPGLGWADEGSTEDYGGALLFIKVFKAQIGKWTGIY